MKFYIYLIQLLFPVVIYAQTPSCQHKTNVPYEYISRIHTYQEPGEVDGHPFTMFNKTKEGWDLNIVLNQIRQRILNSPLKLDNADTITYYIPVDEYASIYKAIYNKIKSNPAPSTCNYNSDCSHPVWVKENAFLALIGIR